MIHLGIRRTGARMWLLRPLDDILSSPAKVAVLRVLLRVGAPLSGREIARRSGVGYGPVWKALQALTASGVLSRQDHGRVSTYVVRYPEPELLRRLRELFSEEDRRVKDAATELRRRVPDAVSIILFGSEARAEARPGSDTDLLVVVPKRSDLLDDAIRDACLDLAEKHGLALSWHVVDLEDLAEWVADGEQFWANVARDGITLQGESVERLARQWPLGRTSSERPAGSGT